MARWHLPQAKPSRRSLPQLSFSGEFQSPGCLVSGKAPPDQRCFSYFCTMPTETRLSSSEIQNAIPHLEARFRTQIPPITSPNSLSLAELSQIVSDSISEDPHPNCIHALVWLEIEKGMILTLGIRQASLTSSTKMHTLLPKEGRKAAWSTLAAALELQLPRLGTPPWLQHLLGFLLLAGFILPFYHLWIGLGLFWGIIILSWQLEKHLASFPYPSFGQIVARTVDLNPQLKFETKSDPATIQALVTETLATI